MKLLATMDAVLRDRQGLYERIATGDGLKRMAGKFLLVFALAAGLYGATMGMFRAMHPQFFFSTYRLSAPDGATIEGRIAGLNVEKLSAYTTDDYLPAGDNLTIEFNTSRPTEPYKVTAIEEEKGYHAIRLAPDSQLVEAEVWRLPAYVALKTPALFLLTLIVCALALYVLNLAFGLGLHFLPTMTLMTFALAATGTMLAVFAPIAALFAIVTEGYHFLKVMHLLIFAVAGVFGVRVLWEGLWRLTGKGAARKIRATALLGAWLILYCFVGGQLAWTLKPFLGTPYLPATPPFRMESGNIYVSFFQSLAKVTRGGPSRSAPRD